MIWLSDDCHESRILPPLDADLFDPRVREEQGYVFFLSALSRHDVISQIPQRIYIATTGRGRELISPAGTFEFLQLNPLYMQHGIEWFEGGVTYAIACPEGPLLDCLYLSTRRGRKFSHFPGPNLSALSHRRLKKLMADHGFPSPIRTHIEKRVAEIWKR